MAANDPEHDGGVGIFSMLELAAALLSASACHMPASAQVNLGEVVVTPGGRAEPRRRRSWESRSPHRVIRRLLDGDCFRCFPGLRWSRIPGLHICVSRPKRLSASLHAGDPGNRARSSIWHAPNGFPRGASRALARVKDRCAARLAPLLSSLHPQHPHRGGGNTSRCSWS
jgi:hypothetical protein